MTMKIVFQKDFDGYKKGNVNFVERTLARRFCENSTAIPYQKHLDNIYDAEQAKIKADVAAKEEKFKADEKRKADLLAKRQKEKAETADSKKQSKSEKAVKPNLKK